MPSQSMEVYLKDAVAVVIKRKGKFLLIKRAKKGAAEDYWCPITGAVEEGETQKEAVLREAQEEMGIGVEPIRKVWECFTEDSDYLLHWWYVQLLNDDVRVDPVEVKDYRWVNVSEMKAIDKMFKADLWFFKEIAKDLEDAD